MAANSYSSITTFEKCARKYHRLKVLKDIEDVQGVEAAYGVEFHTAAEVYVRDGEEMPSRFKHIEPMVASLKALPGDKYVELKFGLKHDEEGKWVPAGFYDEDVEWRGIADLVVVNGVNGRLIDYKTGKNSRYADLRQLDLMAGALFVLFPDLETIKGALLYVVSNDLIPKEYHWEKMDTYLSVFDPIVKQLAVAHETGVWAPTKSPLCAGWCPVTDCEHWKPKRK